MHPPRKRVSPSLSRPIPQHLSFLASHPQASPATTHRTHTRAQPSLPSTRPSQRLSFSSSRPQAPPATTHRTHTHAQPPQPSLLSTRPSQPCAFCTCRGEQAKYQCHIVEPIEQCVTRAEYDELKTRFDQFSAPMNIRTSPSPAEALRSEEREVERVLRRAVSGVRRLIDEARLSGKFTRMLGKKGRVVLDRLHPFSSTTGRTVDLLSDRLHPGLQSNKPPRQRTDANPGPPPLQTRLRILAHSILRDREQRALIGTLTGDDAQCVADFFSLVLQEGATPDADQRKHILSLLCKLAKAAGVYPQCYFLKGVLRDPEPIAGGGFADVYKGKYEEQAICLKVARVYQKKDNTRLLRIHAKEIMLWAHLFHPNILPFYGVYQLDEPAQRICIVSPWMENSNLHAYLDDNPGTCRILLLLDIIEGLAYLHQSGVVHGDLKAENILVSSDKRALISDFGLSYIVTNSGLSNTPPSNGTLRWKAPELFANHKDAPRPTQKSDIWSFSCICYEVLAREVPFYQYNDDQVTVILSVTRKIPSRPSEGHIIDDEMWNIMEKCWNYVPGNRPICHTIRQSIANLQVQDDRVQSSTQRWEAVTFWKSMREKSGTKVDFKRAEKILLRIQGLRGTHKAPAK